MGATDGTMIGMGLRAVAALTFLLAVRPALAVEATGHAVDLPGVKLWYTDTGGDNPAIILLHANTGTSATWAPQSEALSAAGYRVTPARRAPAAAAHAEHLRQDRDDPAADAGPGGRRRPVCA